MTENQTGNPAAGQDTTQLLEQILAAQKAGQLQTAIALYQRFLQAERHNPAANHNLGWLMLETGQAAESLPYFSAALDADPSSARFWLGYIEALSRAGLPDDAKQILALARQQGLEGEEVEELAARLEGTAGIVAPARREQPNPYQLVNARHGRFLVSPYDVYLGRAVIEYGEYGEIEWKFLEQLMPRGKDAIEVGANIGTHTVSMARKLAGMERRLLAVEPQPVVFQNMCANLALNGLFNVIAENAACGSTPGWLTFQAPDYSQENNSGSVSMREDGSGDQRVRSLPMDDLVPPEFNVGLIKIDVEGFEQKVLEGAVKTITRFRPTIYLENDRVEKSKDLIEWLWSAGYKMWWHIPPLFNPENFAGRSDNIYGNVVSFNMLALPNESTIEVEGLPAVEDSSVHPLLR